MSEQEKETILEELCNLRWNDFSTYPKQRQRIVICAKGFDTKERIWKRFFFKINYFNAIKFPDKKVEKWLERHHARWQYLWLPQRNVKHLDDLELLNLRLHGEWIENENRTGNI